MTALALHNSLHNSMVSTTHSAGNAIACVASYKLTWLHTLVFNFSD